MNGLNDSTISDSLHSAASLRTAAQDEPLEEVTEEQRLAMMLGRAEPSFLLREDLCGACGVHHPNPRLLDLHPLCANCFNCIRLPSSLRKRYEGTVQRTPLEIVFATYGHREDSRKAVDVTQVCRAIAGNFELGDRIAFKASQDLQTIFGDPAPNERKQIRIRYRINGRFGIAVVNVLANNHVEKGLLLIAPKSRLLNILRASYGYPKGRNTTGRMAYDVTEYIQGLADLRGGSYLLIDEDISMTSLLHDPCPGYPKDLIVEFDIDGKSSTIVLDENRGFIRADQDVCIRELAIVAPLIFVESAYYGITPTARRDRLEAIASKLNRISVIEYRIREGLNVSAEDMSLRRMKPSLMQDQLLFRSLPTQFVNIAPIVQKIADNNIFYLDFRKDAFDPNQAFTNPLPGQTKLLEINLRVIGHDSEQLTSSSETTLSGYPRNFIAGSFQRFLIDVTDFVDGRGMMSFSLEFGCKLAFAPILIQNAVYGYLGDLSRVIDVTREVQGLVDVEGLRIPLDLNLNQLFTDPSPGSLKQLRIQYTSRGIRGCIRVREKDDRLISRVQLGYKS